MPTITYEKRLTRARVLIQNLPKNAQLIAALETLGVQIPAAQAEGQRLLDAARAAMDEKARRVAHVAFGWAQIHAAHERAWAMFQDHRERAQLDIASTEIRYYLRLDECYAKGRPNQLIQMQRFYRVLLPSAEAQALLTSSAMGPVQLAAANAAIETLTVLSSNVIALEAEKRLSTKRQTAALKSLDRWYSRMRRLVVLAAEDHPHLAEIVDWELFR